MSVSSDHDRAPRGDEEEAWECAAEDTCGTIELPRAGHTTQSLHLNILLIRQPGQAGCPGKYVVQHCVYAMKRSI